MRPGKALFRHTCGAALFVGSNIALLSPTEAGDRLERWFRAMQGRPALSTVGAHLAACLVGYALLLQHDAALRVAADLLNRRWAFRRQSLTRCSQQLTPAISTGSEQCLDTMRMVASAQRKFPQMPVRPLLTSTEVFVPVADLVAFEAFQSDLAADFAPRCEFELHCVRTIAHSLWTIRRTRTLERRMQERCLAEGLIDPLLDLEWAKQLRGILDLRRQAERSELLALKELRAYRASHPEPPEPAAGPVAVAAAGASAAPASVVEMPAKQKKAARPFLVGSEPNPEVGLPPLQNTPGMSPGGDHDKLRSHAA